MNSDKMFSNIFIGILLIASVQIASSAHISDNVISFVENIRWPNIKFCKFQEFALGNLLSHQNYPKVSLEELSKYFGGSKDEDKRAVSMWFGPRMGKR